MRLSTACWFLCVCVSKWHGKGEERRRRHPTHPERLLGEEVRMTTPRPQTARAETSHGVILGPRETCTGPVRACVILPVFPCVKRELLIICHEFEREERERGQS